MLQYEFFQAYLEECGEEVNDDVLASMYREVNTFVMASHFFWGLWSILQSEGSDIPFGFRVCIPHTYVTSHA